MKQTNLNDDKQRESFINECLKVEQRFTPDFFNTFMNRPWLEQPTEPLQIDNPSPPTNERRDGEFWPGGGTPPQRHAERLVFFVMHSWKFVRKFTSTTKAIGMAVFCGAVPAVETIVFSWIADGIGPNGN